MSAYPVERARLLIDALTAMGAKNEGEVFVSELSDDPHGYDYRRVIIDVTRLHWRQMRAELLRAGWQDFGEDSLSYDLSAGHYLVAEPNF